MRDYIPEGDEKAGGIKDQHFDFIPESGEVPEMPVPEAIRRRRPDPGFPKGHRHDFEPEEVTPAEEKRREIPPREEKLALSEDAALERREAPAGEAVLAPAEEVPAAPPAKNKGGRPKKTPSDTAPVEDVLPEAEPPPAPEGFEFAGTDNDTGEPLFRSVKGKKGGELFTLHEVERLAPIDTGISLPIPKER